MSIYVNPDSNTACQLTLLSYMFWSFSSSVSCMLAEDRHASRKNFRSSDVHFVNSDSPKGIWVVPDSYLSVVFDTEFVLHIAFASSL